MASVVARIGMMGGKTMVKNFGKKAAKTAAKKMAKKGAAKFGKKGLQKLGKGGIKKMGKKTMSKLGKKNLSKLSKKGSQRLSKTLGKKISKKDLTKNLKKPFEKLKKFSDDKKGGPRKSQSDIMKHAKDAQEKMKQNIKNKVKKMFSSEEKSEQNEEEISRQQSETENTEQSEERKGDNKVEKKPKAEKRKSWKAQKPEKKKKKVDKKKEAPFKRKKSDSKKEEKRMKSYKAAPQTSEESMTEEEEESEPPPKSKLQLSNSTVRGPKPKASTLEESSDLPTSDTNFDTVESVSTVETSEVPASRRPSMSTWRRPSMSLKKARIWSRASEESPARRASTVRRTSDGSNPLRQSKTSMTLGDLKDNVKKDLFIAEASKEMDDPEFNLMLFRLAKQMILESNTGNDGETKMKVKKKKKKQKTSEWLQALSMVVDAQKEGNIKRIECNTRRTCECYRNRKENTRETTEPSQPPVEHQVVGSVGIEPLPDTEGKLGTGDSITPHTAENKPGATSTSESSGNSTDTSTSSSSSNSRESLLYTVSKLCNVIRSLNRSPARAQSTHKSHDCCQSRSHVTQCSKCSTSRTTQPPHTQDQYSNGCPGTCPAPTYPTMPMMQYGLPVPMPYCVNPGVSSIQCTPALEPAVITNAVIEPNIVYLPDYYF